MLTGIDPDRAECVAVGLVASSTAGITQWCVDAVTAHLRTREQFGKVIGTFQALQHNAAMLLVNSELATAAAWDAVRAVDEPLDQHRLAAAGAAVIAISPTPDLVLDALTMFGAIGYTWEHDVHLYWRRATSLAASIGAASRWARRLGEMTTQPSSATCRSTSATPNRTSGRRWPKPWMRPASFATTGPDGRATTSTSRTGPQRDLIAEAGLIAPHWPPPWGIDAGPLRQLIIDEEFDKRPDLVRPSLNIAEWILPSVMRAAPKELQERLIPPTQRGEIVWCQLFSEPGAGSDLAALTTRATKVDGGWNDQRPQDLDVVGATPRTTGRCWRAPTRTRASTAASATSSSTCDPPASRSSRSRRPPAMRTSTRSSSPTCSCPTTCCWVSPPTGGTSRSPPWPKSVRPSADTSSSTGRWRCAGSRPNRDRTATTPCARSANSMRTPTPSRRWVCGKPSGCSTGSRPGRRRASPRSR